MTNNEMFESEAVEAEIVEKIEHESTDLVTKAQEMAVKTPEHYQGAAEFLKSIKTMMIRVDKEFDENIQKAHATWKGLLGQKAKYSAPLKDAELLIKRKMGDYNNEQERIAREKQAKIEEQARKEREALLKKAQEAEAKGKSEKAEELRQQAATAPVPVVEKAVPKVAGVKTIDDWKVEVTDPALVPKEYWIIDTAKMEKVVKATKGALQIPGTRIWKDTRISGSGY